MLGFALALQIIAVTGVTQGVDTATYKTPALRALVLEAARINHRVPATLGRYHAQLESEISIGATNGVGAENSLTLEQVASDLTWNRLGEFEQHVIGYRQQAAGLQFSTLGVLQNSWAVPSLYGNRLALLFGSDTGRRGIGRGSNDRRTMFAVHPLSDDRERYYRYAGGDTIQELKVGDRTIRIVRIDVAPHGILPARSVVFTGEVDLDVDRKHIVRMRGAFAVAGDEPQGALNGILKATRLEGIAYVELVNSEVNQEFWLPSYQRFEAQATAAVLGDSKAVFRIVSRFRNYEIETPAQAHLAVADTLRSAVHALTKATLDSLAKYGTWNEEIGAATSATHADDFTDVSPARYRGEGPGKAELQAERLSDFVRFNRIEGLYTGAGLTYHGNATFPGYEFHLQGGYAWTEQTLRGRAAVELKRGAWRYAIRAGRSLDNTNDFRNTFDSAGSVGSFFGQDRYDYVSRGFALASVQRDLFGSEGRVRVESGWMRDEATVNHVGWSPVKGKLYLPNRTIAPGDYLRTQLVYQWHPDANAEYVRTGWGAQLKYVRGDGQVKFQRLEVRAEERVNRGRWTYAGRFDAGTMLGSDFPPQYLFEAGSESGLTGYNYKEFVGTEIALLRGLAMYRLGVLERPIQITERFWLPGIAPAVAVGVQSVWTAIPGGTPASIGLNALTTQPPYTCSIASAARSNALGTGGSFNLVSTGAQVAPASNGAPCGSDYTTTASPPRTTISAGLRFFGGAFGIMVGRPIDHSAPWKLDLQFGRLF